MEIHYYQHDLPNNIDWGKSIAIDTETLGLNPLRDRLCLIQISKGDGHCHLVHFPPGCNYDAPNLKKLLSDKKIEKIFHFARFDLAVIYQYLGVMCEPIFCTKIASKLTRTYSDRHGLKDLCSQILNIDISKQQQASDWGNDVLKPEQLNYAATDVLYLHKLKEHFVGLLEREKRDNEAQKCFEFLATRAKLDLMGWQDQDIFQH